MRTKPLGLAPAPLALLAALTAFAANTPDPVYTAMRQSPIVESIVVENVVIRRNAGVITLKSGTIGFTAPAMGRDFTAVFTGEGEFTFAPPQAMEKNYLTRRPTSLAGRRPPHKLGISGSSSIPIKTLLPKKPQRLLVNAFHDVLEQ